MAAGKAPAKPRRRMTASGLSVAIVMALVLAAAWNTGTNLLYIVFGGIASFYLVSWWAARQALRGVTVTCQTPRAVHRDDPCGITVRLDNGKWLTPIFGLRIISDMTPDQPLGVLYYIPPRRSAVFHATIVFAKRGVHTAPGLTLETSYPFGLLRTRLEIRQSQEIVVYPKIRAVKAARIEQKQGIGDVQRSMRSQGDEFYHLREYVPGDDPRRIAWRQSARLQSLVVRELELQTARSVMLLFDTRAAQEPEQWEEDFELAVDLTASLAMTLLSRQCTVALTTPDGYVEAGEAASHGIRMLDFLARVTPRDPASALPPAFEAPEGQHATYMYIAADPARWGAAAGTSRLKTLDPREVIHA